MRERKILAFYSPYPGAGKRTAAEYLYHRYLSRHGDFHYIRSFSATPYLLTQYVLVSLCAGNLDARKDKDEPIEELNGASPRDLLIAFGEAGRKVDPDIWVKYIKRHLAWSTLMNTVIDDLRFPNEYAMLREAGAKIVRITNPGREVVRSETEALLEGYEFDAELVNDKQNLEAYYAQLDAMVASLWPSAQGGNG